MEIQKLIGKGGIAEACPAMIFRVVSLQTGMLAQSVLQKTKTCLTAQVKQALSYVWFLGNVVPLESVSFVQTTEGVQS